MGCYFKKILEILFARIENAKSLATAGIHLKFFFVSKYKDILVSLYSPIFCSLYLIRLIQCLIFRLWIFSI